MDNAFEMARAAYGTGAYDDATLEFIFPELKESRDEQIRKWLIEDINRRLSCWTSTEVTREEVIAWLEKQNHDGKKWLTPAELKRLETLRYEAGFDDGVRSEMEKQKEQNTNSKLVEKEKNDFVSGQFIQCKLSFNEFKEGEHYWLEYIGDDMYVGRSDNILNQKFHITPRQLFTLFSQELEEVQRQPQEEKQASLPYEPPFDENPSDKEIIEALIHHLNEQDGFLTAINCVSTKAILSWLKKQKEQKPRKFKLGDKVHWHDDDTNVITITGFRDDAYLTDSAYGPILFKDEDNWEIIKQKPAEIASNQFDGITYGMQGCSTEKSEDRFEEAREKYQVEWSEDWREEDIQTRFAFYTYKDDPSVLYLSNVFVEEASRNHGFGTRILSAAEKVAETIGATTISLKVKQDSPANDWYRKNGYGYVTFEDGYDWLEKNLEYMKPNKQEWSEDDKKMRDRIIDILNRTFSVYSALGTSSTRPSCPTYKDEIDWLKSLHPQPKQEWDAHDKAIVGCIAVCLDGQFVTEAARKQCLEWFNKHRIDFLNSTSWRPSEEQMKALINCVIGDKYDVHALVRLWAELKKL